MNTGRNRTLHLALMLSLCLTAAAQTAEQDTEPTGTYIGGSVYGGGALANTGNTSVNLNGGTIAKDVYGGGMGSKGDHDVEAKVGSVTVELNKDAAKAKQSEDDADANVKGCVVRGNIFGCNNINGTPTGTVTVHVYGTQHDGKADIADKVAGNYDLNAVYGGGNQAEYNPTDLENGKTEVFIEGCELTSIQQVYGGGNAASTPATSVEVNGAYEIDEVFGGGNGKDPISETQPNPGANVGYHAYDDDADYATRNSSTYTYGSGKASVSINGGKIHAVYGGSNTKGNVREIAIALLEDQDLCSFNVDEAYGGGKSAPMDGKAILEMKCIPGMDYAYGGARNADVNEGVTLNITNGTFKQVFGGNNEGGFIYGPITVNIEETGCRPVIIGELYGGGNNAPYSVYGYEDSKPREAQKEGEEPYADPKINVRSFTSIGNVFGGGYGANAVMVANPKVYISVVEDADTEAQKQDAAEYEGKTLDIDGRQVTLPSHTKGEMGAIGNVYGGGNAAKLIGNTSVNIATEKEVTFVTLTGEEAKKTVAGADIRGNVFGGGNAAEVTGNTTVNIGKERK